MGRFPERARAPYTLDTLASRPAPAELEAFGRRLRDRRIGQGLTQAQVAERMGVSYHIVGQLESGVRLKTMKTSRLIAWARALGFSVHLVEGR